MSCAPAASRLANPFVKEVPAKVETVLTIDDLDFTTISFNDRGTYLAAGSHVGELVIWDLVTLKPALRIQKLHTAEINSVSWVKKGRGRLICTTSPDGYLKIFNLETREVIKSIKFKDELIGASVHPENLEECLVCLGSRNNEVPWPGLYSMDTSEASSAIVKYVPQDVETSGKCYGVAATFSKHGKLVFVGGQAGAIYAFSTKSGQFLNVFLPDPIRGLPKGWIVALSLSQNGKVLLTDGGGKMISVFDVVADKLCDNYNELPGDASIEMIQDALRWRVGKILTFRRHLLDVVGSTKWSDMCCSGQAEYVLGLSSARDVHELFIWNVTGHLVEVLRDTSNCFGVVTRSIWHPWRTQIATINGSGQICLWGNTSSSTGDRSWLSFPGLTDTDNNRKDSNVASFGSPPIVTGSELIDPDVTSQELVNFVASDSFPEVFSEDEDSDEEIPSIRTAPRCLTRGIGYFIQATIDEVNVDASLTRSSAM